MRTYNQYCPIARASEILAERWTPIILRNLHAGQRTFNGIAEGAPGLSRALLTKRLRELERFGVITITPKPDGHGSYYDLTEAGIESARVIKALATWGDRWTEVLDEHSDVGFILWSWVEAYVRHEALPDRRVVVRFDYLDHRGRSHADWLLIENGSVEACAFDPGHGDDVVATIDDTVVFARWHLGLVDWGTVLRSAGCDSLVTARCAVHFRAGTPPPRSTRRPEQRPNPPDKPQGTGRDHLPGAARRTLHDGWQPCSVGGTRAGLRINALALLGIAGSTTA